MDRSSPLVAAMKRLRFYFILMTLDGRLAYPALYPRRRQCEAAKRGDEQVVRIDVQYGFHQKHRTTGQALDARQVVSSFLRLRQ
jgi:hypothetical protein